MVHRYFPLLLLLLLFTGSCRIVSVSASSTTVICFTFDDQHEGVYRAALPVMNLYHFRATCFVNSGKLGWPECMTRDELTSLHNTYQWEIGGHSLLHKELTELSYEDATTAIEQDYQNLVAWGFAPHSFALPSGDCPMEYYPLLMNLYDNVRGSNDVAMSIPINRYSLGYFPYQTGWSAQVVKDRIQRGIADRENLIIIGFHRLDGPPSSYPTDCSLATFTEIVRYVNELGLTVLPLDEAVELLARR